jgi:RNA polymerase sigma-70 factor (ECF subfamily)
VPAPLIDGVVFEAIYREHAGFVRRCVRRLGVSNHAIDDVTQEIFLVIARRHRDFEARSSIRTWIFSIVVSTVRNHRRSLRRNDARLVGMGQAPEKASDDPSAPEPYRLTLRAENVRMVHSIIDELDDDKRVVFMLFELNQHDARRIGETLGVSVNTVYSRLRAARQQFEAAVARRYARENAATARRHGNRPLDRDRPWRRLELDRKRVA